MKKNLVLEVQEILLEVGEAPFNFQLWTFLKVKSYVTNYVSHL